MGVGRLDKNRGVGWKEDDVRSGRIRAVMSPERAVLRAPFPSGITGIFLQICSQGIIGIAVITRIDNLAFGVIYVRLHLMRPGPGRRSFLGCPHADVL